MWQESVSNFGAPSRSKVGIPEFERESLRPQRTGYGQLSRYCKKLSHCDLTAASRAAAQS
ncbi:hypothetical protein PILCRDRAFT_826185 [Piloderma croceum F 1598]|uniref:Uncharacterized protein n=1 Tax=Piloderma croceum (strain F 1598) TaxID=765440 RepID=A0A0C3BH27_PILCF|nr:hypothetical protein PILCRDRAFT_826185 [Piloderma croceum F 1598]